MCHKSITTLDANGGLQVLRLDSSQSKMQLSTQRMASHSHLSVTEQLQQMNRRSRQEHTPGRDRPKMVRFGIAVNEEDHKEYFEAMKILEGYDFKQERKRIMA